MERLVADSHRNRCVRASLFGSFGQLDGTAGVVKSGDKVRIVYSRSTDGLIWTQTVTNAVTGAALSSFSHASGPMTGYVLPYCINYDLTASRWGTGTECDNNCSGTVSAQTYSNTTITLASKDTAFGSTLRVSGGTTYSGLSVSIDGTVWHIDSINIPAMD